MTSQGAGEWGGSILGPLGAGARKNTPEHPAPLDCASRPTEQYMQGTLVNDATDVIEQINAILY